jgi:hypothetical protein
MLAVLICFCMSCNTPKENRISAPKYFFKDQAIELGESLDEIKNKRAIEPAESTDAWIDKGETSELFHDFAYKFKARKLSTIYANGSVPESVSVDYWAKKIVKICCEAYGDSFIVSEGKMYGDTIPYICWTVANKATAIITYFPDELYGPRRKKCVGYSIISFTLKEGIEQEVPSNKFTRKKLRL